MQKQQHTEAKEALSCLCLSPSFYFLSFLFKDIFFYVCIYLLSAHRGQRSETGLGFLELELKAYYVVDAGILILVL